VLETKMRRSVMLVSFVAFAAFGLVSACSSSSSSSSGSSGSEGDDGGPLEEAGGGDAADSSRDSGPANPVNGCTIGKNYTDKSGASDPRTIDWTFPLSSTDRCIEIAVGQTVTWQAPGGGPASFTQYSITASGGDSPNPIASIDTSVGTVKFPKKGTFGYASPDAPALTGAINVK
jgi:hypothetical protein